MDRRHPPTLGESLRRAIAEQAATSPHTLSLDVKKTEKQFQAEVLYLARRNGWMCYHTHDSRRSKAGFPDLVMLRGSGLIVAELKVTPNKPTPAQEEWLAAFRAAGVTACLWVPESWPEIERALA